MEYLLYREKLVVMRIMIMPRKLQLTISARLSLKSGSAVISPPIKEISTILPAGMNRSIYLAMEAAIIFLLSPDSD